MIFLQLFYLHYPQSDPLILYPQGCLGHKSFYDPGNPEGRGSEDLTEDNEGKTTEEISRSLRSPMLSFSNTDMAFKDDILVTGSYHGFNMYKIDSNGIPNLISSVVCKQQMILD